MPEHSATTVTLAPVSLTRSRLFRPMLWARSWHGAWYVTDSGTSPAINSRCR
jgi:hypothetical protein